MDYFRSLVATLTRQWNRRARRHLRRVQCNPAMEPMETRSSLSGLPAGMSVVFSVAKPAIPTQAWNDVTSSQLHRRMTFTHNQTQRESSAVSSMENDESGKIEITGQNGVELDVIEESLATGARTVHSTPTVTK